MYMYVVTSITLHDFLFYSYSINQKDHGATLVRHHNASQNRVENYSGKSCHRTIENQNYLPDFHTKSVNHVTPIL